VKELEPKPTKPEISVWNSAETQEFFAYAGEHSVRMEPLYRLAAATAMRRGEIGGLMWHHVGLEKDTVRVEQTRLYADGTAYVEKPKTASSLRTITTGPTGTSALLRAEAIQSADRQLLGEYWEDTGFVFTKEGGKPLHPDYITKRFQRDVKHSGVRRITFHGLRHTFATTAVAAGQNLKSVSEVLGHANPETTIAIYTQYVPGMHSETVLKVASELFGDQESDEL
jgi:integrase